MAYYCNLVMLYYLYYIYIYKLMICREITYTNSFMSLVFFSDNLDLFTLVVDDNGVVFFFCAVLKDFLGLSADEVVFLGFSFSLMLFMLFMLSFVLFVLFVLFVPSLVLFVPSLVLFVPSLVLFVPSFVLFVLFFSDNFLSNIFFDLILFY